MRILLLAGEESGLLYAERIRIAILGMCPSAEFRGYADYGFRTEDLAVIGIFPILLRLFYFLRVKRTMERAIDDWRPDVVCSVDYPGMNLRLTAYAKARGVRTVHVVCPQVWAWKKGRIPKIEASVDELCCFFPFEPALFKPGFASFVGHPLVEEMRKEAGESTAGGSDRQPSNAAGVKRLAILPGSRMGEIERHLPILLRVVATLQEEFPDLQVTIPAASPRAYDKIVALMSAARAGDRRLATARDGNRPDDPAVALVRGHARDALRTADAAVVASGTATLEAALAGCPTVLVYRVSWLFAAILRRLIKDIRHIGLANVIAEKAGTPCPMPELLQEDFTDENVLSQVRPWLADSAANAAARRALNETMELLRSDGGAIDRIARRVVGEESERDPEPAGVAGADRPFSAERMQTR